MQIIKDLEQGSTEWHDVRRCKVTGTKLKDVMGTPFSQFGLIAELIAEKGTEQTKAFRVTPEMERGIEEEDFAIKLFEKQTGKKVDRVGICISDEFDWLALSPDGLIELEENEGKYSEALEIKSPNSATAIKYRLMNMFEEKELGLTASKRPFLGIPAEYKWQIVNYFVVNQDLRKLYFAIYDERFIEAEAKLNIVEVNWDNEILQEAITEAKFALIDFRIKWQRWEEAILPTNF